MNEILTFTDTAAEYIKEMLTQCKSLGFRVSVKKTGCSGYSYVPAMIDQEVEGDLYYKTKSDFNLYLDPHCIEFIKGLTVDFVEENQEGRLKQRRLVFINPNEKSRCGCGESFNV